MITLFDRLVTYRDMQARKHELGENYARDEINKLSNYEFLEELSDALEVIFAERRL